MAIPLEIVLRDVEPYEKVIKDEIRKRAEKLEHFYTGILSCRVVVDKPHKRHHEGNLYQTTIDILVPNKKIVVSHEHPMRKDHADIFVSIHHAFDAAIRQIEEYVRVSHKDVKCHDLLPHGVIAQLFLEQGYGFIESSGRTIYFHRNSVLDGFDNLTVGTEVRFEEEEGEKGPQASTVKIVRKAHKHHRRH